MSPVRKITWIIPQVDTIHEMRRNMLERGLYSNDKDREMPPFIFGNSMLLFRFPPLCLFAMADHNGVHTICYKNLPARDTKDPRDV